MFIFSTYLDFSQIGVNTHLPKTPMDIDLMDSDIPNGFLLPRLSVSQLNLDTHKYASVKQGALIYILQAPDAMRAVTHIKTDRKYYLNKNTLMRNVIDKNSWMSACPRLGARKADDNYQIASTCI